MCNLKQCLAHVIFLMVVFMPMLGQASGDSDSDYGQDIQQLSPSLITAAPITPDRA